MGKIISDMRDVKPKGISNKKPKTVPKKIVKKVGKKMPYPNNY